jgi:hypothetical protein
MDLLLSRVGLFDIESDRNQAVKRLMNTRSEHCWYQNDQGLRFLSKTPPSRPLKYWDRQVTDILMYENGFDPAQPSMVIANNPMVITRHALQRWHQRANIPFPSVELFSRISDNISTEHIINGLNLPHPDDEDLFYPIEGGALIAMRRVNAIHPGSLITAKKYSTMGAYQYNKNKHRIVGAYLPIETLIIVKTYLGWDELEQGGTYDSFDWYKKQFVWNQMPAEWNTFIKDLDI